MKRLLHFISFCALIFLVSCGPNSSPPKANGKVINEQKEVSGFKRVALKVPAKLVIQQTGKEGLEIEADDRVVEKIKANVEKGVLTIEMERGDGWKGMFWGVTQEVPQKPITMRLSVKNLDSVSLDGTGDITSEGVIQSEDLDLKLSGSGTVRFEVKGKQLKSNISGTGAIFVVGDVDKQDINISGSGRYEANDLKSKSAEIKISGSGDVVLNVKDKLNVNISGSGNVAYQGRPKVKQTISGSGSVQRLE